MLEIKNQKGAVILEFALIGGIFLITIFAILDLSRYFAAQALLTKGAQNGLAVAKSSSDFGIDIQNLDTECPKDADGNVDQACITATENSFRAARQQVIDAATALPLSTFISDTDGEGSIRLRASTNLDRELLTNLRNDANQSAIVLRPGDVAKVVTSTDQGDQVVSYKYHPQICPPGSLYNNCQATADPTIGSKRARSANEPMATLFENYPIVVELEAEVKMFLPIFDTMTVKGTAIGYRETINRSRVGMIPDQLACPITVADCACGPEFMELKSCECKQKAGLCQSHRIQFGTFYPDSCSCECDIPAEKQVDSNDPNSQCSHLTGGPYYRDSNQTAPLALWVPETCSCKCNDDACTAGTEIPLADGRVAVISRDTAGSAGYCTCGCSYDASDPRNGGRRACPGGKTFESKRCGCTCWAGEKQHCDRAIAQGGPYIWDAPNCHCICTDPDDPDCQPVECHINNNQARIDAPKCDAQDRKFDYETCTCSDECFMQPGRECPGGQVGKFDGTSCSCACPSAPTACGAGDYWDPTACQCQQCVPVSCGAFGSFDPITCKCVSGGGGT